MSAVAFGRSAWVTLRNASHPSLSWCGRRRPSRLAATDQPPFKFISAGAEVTAALRAAWTLLTRKVEPGSDWNAAPSAPAMASTPGRAADARNIRYGIFSHKRGLTWKIDPRVPCCTSIAWCTARSHCLSEQWKPGAQSKPCAEPIKRGMLEAA